MEVNPQANGLDRKFKLSLFNTRDGKGTGLVSEEIETSFGELTPIILNRSFSLSEFRDGKRDKAHFMSTSALALDFDGDLALDAGVARVKETGLTCIVAPTKSHLKAKGKKPPKDRYRVLVPLSRPITSAEDYSDTLSALRSIFPESDPACVDTARFFFPSTTVAFEQEGRPFDPVRDWSSYRGDFTTLDLVRLFQDQGLYLRSIDAQKHAVRCPWIEEHTTQGETSTVIWAGHDGKWPTFNCSHSHCESRQLKEVLATFPREEVERYCSRTFRKDFKAEMDGMNERYAVIENHNNQTLVTEVIPDPALGYSRRVYFTFADFRNRHSHETVTPPNSNEPISMGKAWLGFPNRRQYKFEAFLPGQKAPPGVLNLWNGFGVEPRPGDWSLLKHHVVEVLCSGNEKQSDYVMNWLARMVQKPHQPAGTAVILKGSEGTGKGALGRALLKLTGEHGIHIVQPRHLTGNFNSQLQHKILAFVDEGFFAGNPEQRGPLFALVTEPEILIEQKGVDVRKARSTLSIVMATNEAVAVPAGVDSRRFFLPNVSDHRRQDAAYFRPLFDSIERGEAVSAMLHDLLALDISEFNPADIPKTEELVREKIQNLKGPRAWLHGCLNDGGVGGVEWRETLVISKAQAYEDYLRYHAKSREYRAVGVSEFGRVVRAVLPGRLLGDSRPKGVRQWVFGSLRECRAAFENHLGSDPLEWDFNPGEAVSLGESTQNPTDWEGGFDAASLFD